MVMIRWFDHRQRVVAIIHPATKVLFGFYRESFRGFLFGTYGENGFRHEHGYKQAPAAFLLTSDFRLLTSDS